MGRSPFLPTPWPGPPGIRIIHQEASPGRAAPPVMIRRESPPTTTLGLALVNAPVATIQPQRSWSVSAAPGLNQGTSVALVMGAAWEAFVPSLHDLDEPYVHGFRRLLRLSRLIPCARVVMATREARIRNGRLRAAYALGRLFAFPLGHQPCEWCGLPTARRCGTCDRDRPGDVCIDCAFVFLGCTACWRRFRTQRPLPTASDALTGWHTQ